MSFFECRDINGLAVKNGLLFMPGPGDCHQCTCESGIPKHCHDIMCHQPQNCSTFRKGARCCDFVCLDDIPSGKSEVSTLEGDFGLRLIASVVTAILSLSLLFFLIHRLRQRKIRSGRQNRQLNEDERSLGSIGYITGSLGYLPGAMERYEEPTAHFPHYPLWKPPGNYFPRGEAPPPYEEAIAATRAEVLAAAVASGTLHATTANFSRDASHLGVSYNAYSGNMMAGPTHRTIPMNLATSASFTLQPERYDDTPAGGGACVSVAAGTVSVTATVSAPPHTRSDVLGAEMMHASQNDPALRTGTLCRSDMVNRPDISHHAESVHRTDSSHRSESSYRPEIHRTDAGLRSEVVHRSEVAHRNENFHRSEASHYRADSNQRGGFRPDINIRSDVTHCDAIHRENSRRHDTSEAIGPYRGEERRLPSVPPPDNAHSLPSSHHAHAHANGMHQSVHSYSKAHHQPATIHSHSYGHHHQLHQVNVGIASNVSTPMPSLDIPPPQSAGNVERESRAVGKVTIPQLTSAPKSGTGVYEDTVVVPATSVCTVESYNPTTYTATLRRGKHFISAQGGTSTLSRRAPLPVATPTLSQALTPAAPTSVNEPSTSSTASSGVANTIPPPTIPSPEPARGATAGGSVNASSAASASASAAAVAAIVAASPPMCTCPRASNPRCICPGSIHSSITSLATNETVPQDSTLSLAQAGFDDNDDYRSECENCKSTHSSNYYLDAEDPEPEITMTLHRKPTETGEENGNAYYRTSLTLPTRHRVVPLHGTSSSCGARDSWFSSMPESSTDESEED